MKRKRKIYSLKEELLKKSQESALAAIQIFNNPLITFKSESFIVLMNIAWTYLLHAYYREKKVEYRCHNYQGQRKKFEKTHKGAFKYWGLEWCLTVNECPLDKPTKDNLLFLIGIRHEIEHQMTRRIDDTLSAKFQACCINYNRSLKELFGEERSLDKIIPLALQLFSFSEEQFHYLKNIPELPQNILDFVASFEKNLDTKEDPKYSYRVIYMRDNCNNEGQADKAYRFVDEKSAEGQEIHNILQKFKNHKKVREKDIIKLIQKNGYIKFTKQDHKNFWQSKWPTAKVRNNSNDAKSYGEFVVEKMWLWYELPWLQAVLEHCSQNEKKYK